MRRLLLLLPVAALAAAGCRANESANVASVATVNGRPIAVEDYAQMLRENGPRFSNELEARTRILEMLVERELIVQEAIEIGIERRPEVAKQIQQEVRVAERRIREETLLQLFLRERVQANPHAMRPTEAEIQAFYQLHSGLPFGNPNAPAFRGPAGMSNLAARQLLFDDKTRRVRPYGEAAPVIAQHLAIQKQQGMMQSVLRTLKEKAKVEVDQAAVASVRIGAPPPRGGAGPGLGGGAALGGAGGPQASGEVGVQVGSGAGRVQTAQAGATAAAGSGVRGPRGAPPPRPPR